MWHTPLAKLALKNTLWLVMGTGVSKFLKLILIVVAAPLLGVQEYGALTFAFGFVSLFIVFSDLGFASMLTREFAAGGHTERDFSALFSLKLLLSIGTLFLIAAGALFFQNPSLYKVILLFATAGLISGLGTFFYSLFQARQQMKYQAWGTFLEAVIVTALSFFILLTTPSATHLAYAYMIGSAIALFVVAFFFHRKIFPLKFVWDPSVWKPFLKMAWPMAVVLLFSTIYFDLSSVMLGTLGSLKETGWYNAGYRPVSAVFIGFNLISVSFFSVLSSTIKGPREEWEKLWNVEVRLLVYLTVPLVVGGMLLAPRIIDFLYGPEFALAVPSLRWSLLAAGALILFIPLKDMLVAAHQQKKALVLVLAGLFLNGILNFVLIPLYGMKGALLSTFFVSFGILLVAWIFTPRWAGFPGTYPVILKTSFTTLFSAAVMGFVISWPALLQFPVVIVILIGVATYAFSLLGVSKILNKEFDHAPKKVMVVDHLFTGKKATSSNETEVAASHLRWLLKQAEQEGWQKALYHDLRERGVEGYFQVGDERRADWTYLLPISKESTVLQLGAEWGHSALAFSKQCKTVTVADESPEKLALLRIRAEQKRISNLTLMETPPDHSFDVVAAVEPFHEMDSVNFMHTRLKKGGYCYAALTRYSLGSFKKRLADAGFSDFTVYTVLPNHQMPLFFLPLSSPAALRYFLNHVIYLLATAPVEVKRRYRIPYLLVRLGGPWLPSFFLPFLIRWFSPSFALIARK